jgi:hypothetical protein
MRYGFPLPTVQELFTGSLDGSFLPSMPAYRISMTRKKSFYVPGVPSSRPGEVVIAGTSLLWLPHCRTNNTIESWTLQFVGEFTRAIEVQKNWNEEKIPDDVVAKSVLNQIEFARAFFPHLCRKYKDTIREITRQLRADIKQIGRRRTAERSPS